MNNVNNIYLSLVYLAVMSVAQTMLHRVDEQLMNDKFERKERKRS
jgi:hypothetical protein